MEKDIANSNYLCNIAVSFALIMLLIEKEFISDAEAVQAIEQIRDKLPYQFHVEDVKKRLDRVADLIRKQNAPEN